jgi:excinuclease ABC subunit A
MKVKEKLQNIQIIGARVFNLKNISLELPRGRLIVVTGVSGSGKSSLVFNTLYAEGHRRYVESLSAYARQFLSRMQKPDVDLIQGISPAIAIEQRVNTGNPRSTVGSVTEVYDYLRLLFARVGRTFSPVSGQQVSCNTVTDVVEHLQSLPVGTRVHLLADTPLGDRGLEKELELTLQKGFTRLWQDGQVLDIEDLLADRTRFTREPKSLTLVIDRFAIGDSEAWNEEFLHRVADSVQIAFAEGNGECRLYYDGKEMAFSERFELDGMTFEKPTPHLFNFNNPQGVCPKCQGFGNVMGYDERLIIPRPELSVKEGAVALWSFPSMEPYKKSFLKEANALNFPIHRSYEHLDEGERKLLWYGNNKIIGIYDALKELEGQTYKIQTRVFLSRFRNYVPCPDCHGSRIRKEALYVKVGNYTIADFLAMPMSDLAGALNELELDTHDTKVAERLLLEIRTRTGYLVQVGLGYLSLNRKASTLSGGETQRINLATSLGSSLVGSLYILDEPSIGLHPRDSERLVEVLETLRDLGNTVLVVEHDEAVMRRADFLVDIGPMAGEHGGEVVYTGKFDGLLDAEGSLTGDYLSGRKSIPVPPFRRKWTDKIRIVGALENNLKNITVDFPIGVLTVLTGVSGSGKTTLVRQILYPALTRQLGLQTEPGGRFQGMEGDVNRIEHVEMVDQNALGRNMRSNPVTYCGAYDGIRELFSEQPLAKENNLKAANFSFNVDGGRCETCKGEGTITVEMQFLPDIQLLCETCSGRRFKQLILQVQYKDQNIYDVLQMSVDEAVAFFADHHKVVTRLKQLQVVGLGYLRLGQSTSTLSGGEAQRLKLATFLSRKEKLHTFYIFDEPTTGLHFHDIRVLMEALGHLVEQDNTVLIIEHNLDVIKCADWIIDLGPEGGSGGGQLVHAGNPETLVENANSYTGKYLKPYLT